MSKIFTLDYYQQKADEKYGTFDIQLSKTVSVKLYNPLRISEEKRERVFQIVSELDTSKKQKDAKDGEWNEVGGDDDTMSIEDVAHMQPLLVEFIQLVGDENAPKLIDKVGHDLAVLMDIFQDYFAEVGLGEASSSED